MSDFFARMSACWHGDFRIQFATWTRHARLVVDIFMRILADMLTSSRGCLEDATRKTASVEFKLNSTNSDCISLSIAKKCLLPKHSFLETFFLPLWFILVFTVPVWWRRPSVLVQWQCRHCGRRWLDGWFTFIWGYLTIWVVEYPVLKCYMNKYIVVAAIVYITITHSPPILEQTGELVLHPNHNSIIYKIKYKHHLLTSRVHEFQLILTDNDLAKGIDKNDAILFTKCNILV